MPSPVGHALAGVAAGWLIAGAPRTFRDRDGLKEAAVFAALGMLPDMDLLLGMHSGPTHSIGAAALVGAVALATAAARAFPRPGRFAVACLAAYGSHVLLDWLGTDASPPLGIMALWPFSRAYYESDLHVFMAISRRYYQGWTFVEQNLRAIAWELVILLPILAAVSRLRARSLNATIALALALLTAGSVKASPVLVQWPEKDPDPAYRDLVALYRSGDIDRATARLATLLTATEGDRRFERWFSEARRENRTSDIEAMFLLFTEQIMSIWHQDHPYPEPLLTPYTEGFGRLRLTLKRINPQSPFLKAWYLLWESFRQLHVNRPPPNALDYLNESVAAFPKDALILLAAGSRHELNWTMSLENRHRDLTPEPFAITRLLETARDFFRRSLTADSKESEARLRLVHVLLELDDVEAVGEVLKYDWSRDGPAFEYLVKLFEGDLHERRGDRTAAAAAYERAAALAPLPQSALVARAHIAHLEGRRTESAQIVAQSLSGDRTASDPWWPFMRGQAWRYEIYLKAARAMVMK